MPCFIYQTECIVNVVYLTLLISLDETLAIKMSTDFLKAVVVCIFSTLNCGDIYAQFVDLSRENSYKKVFVETDDFDDTYLKVLEQSYPKARTESLQFSMLNDLAYYWHTRNLVKALDFTEKGLALTRKAKDTLWEGRFQITKGSILLRMEKLYDAEAVLKSAKTKVCEQDLPFLYTQMGYVYERRGELVMAADYALESLHLGAKLGNKKAVALANSDFSNLFWKQSKFQTGLQYGLASLEIFQEWGITDLDYGFTLYVVGNNYLALGEYRKALQYYEHSLNIGERYGFYNNLSDVYISLVALYGYLEEHEKAAIAGENALKYAELLENEFMVMRAWLAIGKGDLLQGNYISAIENIQKCISIASDDFGDEYYLSQAYETLGKAYAGNHNYREAYAAFAHYDILKNRIFTAEADHRTSLLQTEFDLAKKEGTILSQGTQIKRQGYVQTLLIIIAILLLSLLLLAYKAIRNKFKVNLLLRKQNNEKEFLLKEIHHRVKNNLEIVSSLLSLQSAQIDDPHILGAMQESQHRVHSMSMIHQKLYMGENLATIEMKDYFVNLGNFITDAYGVDTRILVDVDMELFELDIDMAIPIGLIVNELLSNSIKHAFPDKRNGKIQIRLKENDAMLQLDVIDNGIGKVAYDSTDETGFGTRLIALLTKQLDGKMILNTNQGTSVSFLFQFSKAA